MNKEKVKQYWQLKNRIGYAVISGDTVKRAELEAEMKSLLKEVKHGDST